MRYLLILAAVFVIYYLRRYWLTPWATFISYSGTKRAGSFLTVRHIHWYPPFTSYEVTYHMGTGKGDVWCNSQTGSIPIGCPRYTSYHPTFHQLQLTALACVAEAREMETEDVLGGELK